MQPSDDSQGSRLRVNPVRVIGVDPGTQCVGWGVIESVGSRIRGIGAGVIHAKKQHPLPSRLKTIYHALSELIRSHAPTIVAVEDIFHSKYAGAALQLGHARGVVLLAAAEAGLEVSAFPPSVVKRCVAGSGRADKEQLARLVGVILGWNELPPFDATDALAVALTCVQASLGLPKGKRSGRKDTHAFL